MIKTIKIIFLSIIQGFTSALPVSSLGHFALFKEVLGFTDENLNAPFYFAVYSFVSFLMMYLYYLNIHTKILKHLFRSTSSIKDGKSLAFHKTGKNLALSLIPMLLLFVPIGKNKFFECLGTYFLSDGSLVFVGGASLMTGVLMFISLWYLKQKYAEKTPLLSAKNSVVFGLYQIPAYIFPGVSHVAMGTSRNAVSDIGIKNVLKETYLYIAPAGLIVNAFRIIYYGMGDKIDFVAVIVGSIFSATITFVMMVLVNKFFSKDTYKAFAFYSVAFGVLVTATSIYRMFF